MATSGVTSGVLTVGDIIKDALIEIHALGRNEPLEAGDADLAMRRLSYMLKSWQSDGANLWRLTDLEIDWPAYTYEAQISASMGDITDVRVIGEGVYERPLQRLEAGDYTSLPNKEQTGSPTIYSLTRALSGTVLRLWPVPTSDIQVIATGPRTIEDVTALTQTLDVPAQYTRCVVLNLAANLAPAFGQVANPSAANAASEGRRLYLQMRADDRPASYFMAPVRGRYRR